MTSRPSVKRDCACPRARHVHGTIRAYQADKCRCAECRDACRVQRARESRAMAYGQWEYPKHPCGSTRRLQALAWLGWTLPQLAAQTGLGHTQLWRIMHDPPERVWVSTARAIRAAYDRLWDQQPPQETRAQRRNATVVRRNARAYGWASPLAWDDETIDNPDAGPNVRGIEKKAGRRSVDEIAVEQAISGRNVHLTSAERSVVVAKLTAMGYSAPQIAQRLRTTKRTVERRRSAA